MELTGLSSFRNFYLTSSYAVNGVVISSLCGYFSTSRVFASAILHCNVLDGTLIGWKITSILMAVVYTTVQRLAPLVPLDKRAGHSLCFTTLMFTITSLTSSSSMVTLNIQTSVLLNGTRILFEGQSQTLKLLLSEFAVTLAIRLSMVS